MKCERRRCTPWRFAFLLRGSHLSAAIPFPVPYSSPLDCTFFGLANHSDGCRVGLAAKGRIHDRRALLVHRTCNVDFDRVRGHFDARGRRSRSICPEAGSKRVNRRPAGGRWSSFCRHVPDLTKRGTVAALPRSSAEYIPYLHPISYLCGGISVLVGDRWGIGSN